MGINTSKSYSFPGCCASIMPLKPHEIPAKSATSDVSVAAMRCHLTSAILAMFLIRAHLRKSAVKGLLPITGDHRIPIFFISAHPW